jgi:hypothetical protein
MVPWACAVPTSRHLQRTDETDNSAAFTRLKGFAQFADVLPPALLHRLIILAGARTRIGRLGVPIALEKEAEAVVAPVVAARNGDIDRRPAPHEATLGLVSRNGDIDRRPAHQETALRLVVEHRDELGAVVGLAA